MKTLIELYSERAIENVIGPETFRPDCVVYMCPSDIYRDKEQLAILRRFFRRRGVKMKLDFVETSIYQSDQIVKQLQRIAADHYDCAVDVTGGTDATLFAAGMFCAETGTPAFTYSRRKNRFYNIINADFAQDVPCDLQYTVDDFFHMAGGTLRKGRVDNQILTDYMHFYDPFFRVFLRYRREWPDIVTFLQRISQGNKEGSFSLKVRGSWRQKGDHGGSVRANQSLLEDLEDIGMIHHLTLEPEEWVSFTFRDAQVRAWLRDVGSVLELFLYKACVDSGIFREVISSAIVDWDGTVSHESVSNEIDVAATRGTVPLFISCKACEVKTPALNELAILRDRFGGKGAKACIVTTEYCNAAARHRAAQLGITVIDLEELKAGDLTPRLKAIMKVTS